MKATALASAPRPGPGTGGAPRRIAVTTRRLGVVANDIPAGGRWVEVPPDRLPGWVDGFAARHGGVAVAAGPGTTGDPARPGEGPVAAGRRPRGGRGGGPGPPGRRADRGPRAGRPDRGGAAGPPRRLRSRGVHRT